MTMKKTLDDSSTIICIGAGGVGKTTVSSVLGCHYALQGKRTLVITVDPARRLMDALGIDDMGYAPKKVDISFLVGSRGMKPKGELFAFMPDIKREWMDFLQAAIKKAEVRHEISSNHFYKYMADGIPGAFEIICSHVLFRLMKEGEYEKIILDTPPSSHSLSFFDVPKKVATLLEQSVFRMLMMKQKSFFLKITKGLAFFSQGVLEKTLEKLLGSHFFSELIDFALTIDALYEPMLDRVKAMEGLFSSPKTSYVLVARPTLASVSDCLNLRAALIKKKIQIHQVIINQVVPHINVKEAYAELAELKKELRQENFVFVENAIKIYESRLSFEKGLLQRLRKEFMNVETKELYLGDVHLLRRDLILNLVKDYCPGCVK